MQKESHTESVGGESSGCKGEVAVAGSSGSTEPVTPGGFINGEGSQEFLSTGRTGRRNAMPDILGQHAETGISDLPERLEALTTDVPAGTSGGRSQTEPTPTQHHAG